MKTWLKMTIIAVLIAMMVSLTPSTALTATTDKEVYYPGDYLTITGTATPNSTVTVVVSNPQGGMVALDQTTAGPDGTFAFENLLRFPQEATNRVPYGTYTVVITDVEANTELELQIRFTSASATISGLVVDSTGQPIEGATVSIKMNDVVMDVATTNEAGEFVATVDEVGTYVIEVSKEGFLTTTETVTIETLPSETSVTIVMRALQLSVSIEAVTRDGKPLFGVAREGETLEVKAKVYYGNQELTNATVKGYLTSGPRMASGLEPLEFTLEYDEQVGMYVGSIAIPSPGLDRECFVTVEAQYDEETASQTISFITLVNTLQQVQSIEERVAQLEDQTQQLQDAIQSLSETVNQLAGTISGLQDNLNNLQTQINTFQTTIQNLQNQLDNLAKKADVESVKNEVNLLRTDLTNVQTNVDTLQNNLANLQNQLNQLQANLNDLGNKLTEINNRMTNLENKVNNLENQVNDLSNQVQEVAGAKGLAQAGLAVGIIAILIALGVMFYINKKISA